MKRRGFTLIELMVVIAIIIILAAIAIPNYLKMTERAKKSRIASDMATLATGLETFKTDWGSYPLAAGNVAIDTIHTIVFDELGGLGGVSPGVATINIASSTNALGEAGGGVYLKPGTLTSIIDPFKDASTGTYPNPNGDGHIYYTGNANHWMLSCYAPTTLAAATVKYMWRTDASSTIATGDTVSALVASTVP